MTELVVHLDGQDVAVRDLGGSGHDVMLLHGLGTNLASWHRVGPVGATRCGAGSTCGRPPSSGTPTAACSPWPSPPTGRGATASR